MPQCLRDDIDGNLMAVGDARPGVARDVGRQRAADARHAGEALQREVVAAEGAAIAAVVIIGVYFRLRLGVFLRITCSLVR